MVIQSNTVHQCPSCQMTSMGQACPQLLQSGMEGLELSDMLLFDVCWD